MSTSTTNTEALKAASQEPLTIRPSELGPGLVTAYDMADAISTYITALVTGSMAQKRALGTLLTVLTAKAKGEHDDFYSQVRDLCVTMLEEGPEALKDHPMIHRSTVFGTAYALFFVAVSTSSVALQIAKCSKQALDSRYQATSKRLVESCPPVSDSDIKSALDSFMIATPSDGDITLFLAKSVRPPKIKTEGAAPILPVTSQPKTENPPSSQGDVNQAQNRNKVNGPKLVQQYKAPVLVLKEKESVFDPKLFVPPPTREDKKKAQQQKDKNYQEIASSKTATYVSGAYLASKVLKGGTLTPQDFGSESEAKKMRKSKKHAGGAEPGEYELCDPIPEPPSSLPKVMPKAPTEAQIKEWFSRCPSAVPVATPLRDKRDPHYKEGAGKNNLISMKLNSVAIGSTGEVAARACSLPFDTFTPAQINRIRAIVAESYKYCVASGPLQGLYYRLIETISKKKPQWRLQPYFERAAQLLPVRVELFKDMNGKTVDELDTKINTKSNSGWPFDKEKKLVVPQTLEIMTEIMNAIVEGKLEEYMSAHPQYSVCKLANKLDLYEWEECSKNIRAYFIFPYHWTWLWSCVWQNISGALWKFTDVGAPYTINAIGFSWQKLGGDALIAWIESCIKKGCGFYALAYADDQLWCIVTPHGVYLIVPDYRRMDLSLHKQCGKFTYQMFSRPFAKLMGGMWDRIFLLGTQMAFDTLTTVGHSLVYFLINFLKSGIPGTSYYDEVASAFGVAIAETILTPDACSNVKDRFDVVKLLEKAWALITQLTGMEIKPNTKEVYIYKSQQQEYNFVFLGKTLKGRKDAAGVYHYAPCSNPVKVMASISNPKRKLNGDAQISAQMTRIRQIIAAGGWHDPLVYAAAKAWYVTQATCANHLAPRPSLEPEDVEDFVYTAEKEILFKTAAFPTEDECWDLYTPSQAYVGAVSPVDPSTQTSADILRSYYTIPGDEEENTEKWADQKPDLPTAGRDYSGNVALVTSPQYPAIDPKYQARARPFTEAEKKKYNEMMARMKREYYDMLNGNQVLGNRNRKRKGERLRNAVQRLTEEVDARVEEEFETLPVEEYEPDQEEYNSDYEDEEDARAMISEAAYERVMKMK